MKRRFEIVVMLKPGLSDPQGKTIEDSLPTMGWDGISGVRMGKHVELTVEADTEDAAAAMVDDVARRVLSNPVIEEFRAQVVEEAG
ncbi:MAG: phosphoribosylformylglycinamidine synthase subunit PurS [Actinomycetota bacterium]|nr:phosphoribosylformylglycinamidine synthase subunit PurS [Actinomycetota bacterium]